MTRRMFLQTSTGALAATSMNAQTPGIRLGFDTYSLRAFHWKSLQLLDYAAAQKLDTVQISGLEDYESLEPAHLRKVKEKAASLGLMLDGGMGCICPTSKAWRPANGDPVANILKGIETARHIGSTSMRCYMGSDVDRHGPIPIEGHIESTVKVLRAVRSQAMDYGVKIAVENHAGDMQARELRMLIETAGKDFVGACLDTGNPMWVMEDPMVTLEVLAPYTVTTHVRDSAVYEHPLGAAAQWTALGDGSIDFTAFMARYRELCPNAGMQLEIITGRPPRVLPYLQQDFWKAFPHANAAEFARFVALAKHGHPFSGRMIIADLGGEKQPQEYQEALKEQQRVDLERSFAYAKEKLGAGIRWRS